MMKTAIQRVIELADILIKHAREIDVPEDENAHDDNIQREGVIMGLEALKTEIPLLLELEASQMYRAYKIGNKVPTAPDSAFPLWFTSIFGMAPHGYSEWRKENKH